MKDKVFPQANDLGKVIRVFIYASKKLNCTKEDIADFCDFDPRQSDYYLGASIFLDLMNGDGTLTESGKQVLSDTFKITEEYYKVIISHPFISKVFSFRLFSNHEESKAYSRSLVYDKYKDYSDSVNTRRADAMLGWCETIIEYIKLNGIIE